MDPAFPDSCLILPFLLTRQRLGGGLFLKFAPRVAWRTVGCRVCHLRRVPLHLAPLAVHPFLAVVRPPAGDTWGPSGLAAGAGGGRPHRGLSTPCERMGVQGREAEQVLSVSSLLFFTNSGHFSRVPGGKFLSDSHLTLTPSSHMHIYALVPCHLIPNTEKKSPVRERRSHRSLGLT